MAKNNACEECQVCVSSGYCVNGTYCYKLKRYVEYETIPPCETKKPTNSNTDTSVSSGKTETVD